MPLLIIPDRVAKEHAALKTGIIVDDVPPRGVAGDVDRRAVRHCRADQRATAGRLMSGSSLNWPTLTSVM